MNHRTPWRGFLLVFCACFLICGLATAAYVQNICQLEYVQMEHLALLKSGKVNNVISKLLYKTQALSALVIQNNGEIQDFERVAATIMDDPAIQNLILAPDGVVQYVYPAEGNEAVIGLDYFSEGEGNLEAVAARDTSQLVLGGPFNLIQGGQALVGRLPVYINSGDLDKHFWGLVSVTLHYPQALEGAELDQLQNQGFAYEIWRVNPDTGERQTIAASGFSCGDKSRYVEQPITILNANWFFRLSPIRRWYEHPETWVYITAGFLISILIASLAMHTKDLRRMKRELEDLTYRDPLTGVLNRRGAFRLLEKMAVDPAHPFLLCFLDLNKFKAVNDTYGHNFGDKMLCHFAQVFQRHIGKEHIFARIGGDEFLLVFCGEPNKEKALQFFAHIREDFQKAPLDAHCEQIETLFSAGIAAYPADSDNLDGLLAIADSEMYLAKPDPGIDG